MVRKIAYAFVVLAVLLSGSGGLASAQAKPPSFQKVFDPAQAFGINPIGNLSLTTEAFKKHLYVSVSEGTNFDTGSPALHLYRSADGKTWEEITSLGIDPNYWVCWDMTVFNGALYMAVHDLADYAADPSEPYLPGLIIRSANGTDWQVVFKDTPDHRLLQGNLPDKFGEFHGMLYFTTEGSNFEDATIHNGQVWRSPNGNPGSWRLVDANLGDQVTSTSSPTPFKGKVYVSGHDSGGMRVWRSANGALWESVGGSLLADSANENDGSLAVFGDALYLSTTTYHNRLEYPGGRIYRTRDGQNWELVVDQGFGNPNHVAIDSLFLYQGALYATANGLNGVSYLYRTRSASGKNWQLVTPDGIGPNTGSGRNMQAVLNGNLFLGSTWFVADDQGNWLTWNAAVYKMVEP